MTQLDHTYERHIQLLEHRARTEHERALRRALQRPSSPYIDRRFDLTDGSSAHEPDDRGP